MQILDICPGSDVTLHCPLCGASTFTKKGTVKPCPHLVYVSSSETVDEPWYRSAAASKVEFDDDSDKHLIDTLKRNFSGMEYLMFMLSEPPPAGLEVYALYSIARQTKAKPKRKKTRR